MTKKDQVPGGPIDVGAWPESSAERTTVLLRRAQEGDQDSLERLLARYLPRLRRWVRARIPTWATGTFDQADLVQETLLRTLRRFDEIQARKGIVFQSYVRRVLDNVVRDAVRQARRRPEVVSLISSVKDPGSSPLETRIGRETLERYELALRDLSEDDQAAVFLRYEAGMSYREVADELDKPSANAARMAVSRATERLIRAMAHGS